MKNRYVVRFCMLLLLFSIVGFGQTATFLSDFEDQNIDAEIGRGTLALGINCNIHTVPNPQPDNINSSNYVIKASLTPGAGKRAEYTVGRHETIDKKYIYSWKVFHPENMFVDVDLDGLLINQWKTWPCEDVPIVTAGYEKFDTLICWGGGIFNDMHYSVPEVITYKSRAEPDCNTDFYNMPSGVWNKFTLEIYWTNSENGYYRIWRNDTLFGYSDHMKTLMDEFEEETCNMFWTAGLYGIWSKTGDETTDSISAYLDDIALYDIDSGFTISSVCPDCEVAPATPTDSNVYKINLQGSYASNGYNNVVTYWAGDTNALNLSNTFGQSNGIDLYLWSGSNMGTGSSEDECFPDGVINKYITWGGEETHQIHLADLNPLHTYTLRLLGATAYSGTTRGTQIWTAEENRDTVLAANNTCNMAELKDLVSDKNGDLIINVKPIGGSAYINSIELVEYTVSNNTSINNTGLKGLRVFPNPVKDHLVVEGGIAPERISIYTVDGKMVKYYENLNKINVSDLHKGIYLVLISTKNSFVTRKIIKE
jgi:hypothetical protein